MGCWNATCAMSHLPIKAYDEVYVWFIVDNGGERQARNHTNADNLYSILGVPFRAKYNGGGGFEDIHQDDQLAFDANLQMIRRGMCNQDPELDLEKLLDRIHERDMFMGFYDEKFAIGHMMVHKHIFDKFMNEYSWEEFVGNPDDWKEHYYVSTGFAIELITDEWVNEVKELQKLRKNDLVMAFESFRRRNRFYYMHFVSDMSYIVSDTNLKSICRGLYLNSILNTIAYHIRMTFGPCAGSGSQSKEYDAYKILIDGMSHIVEEQSKPYDEDDE